MLLKKLMIALSVIVMVVTLAMVQGCSESESPVESVATDIGDVVNTDIALDENISFELSAFDTNSIVWDYDLRKDLNVSSLATSSWSTINARIYWRAFRDYGKYVGVECKPWASRVVYDVTGYWLPTTHPNDYYLYGSSHVTKIVDGHVAGGGTIERGIGYGNIIQMRVKTSKYTGPHTAIFISYAGAGMWWIDSNWYTKSYPKRVFLHYISFDDFRRIVGTEYSIYQAWD